MTSTRQLHRFIVCGLCLLSTLPLIASGRASAEGFEESGRLLEKWKDRTGWYKTVRYRLSGSQVMSPALWDKEHAVREAVTTPESAVVLFDIANKRIRVERQTHLVNGSDGPETIPYAHTYTFGSEGLKFFFNRQENLVLGNNYYGEKRPDLTFLKGNTGVFPPLELEPLFWGHGIVSTPRKPLRANAMTSNLEPDDLIFHGVATQNQHPCQVFRTDAIASGFRGQFAEYWVSGNSASVLKKILLNGKSIVLQYDVVYTNSPDRPMPSSWVATIFLGDKLGKSYAFKVDALEANPPVEDDDFDIPMKTGMIVSKDDNSYRVEEGGKLTWLYDDHPADSSGATKRHQEQFALANGEPLADSIYKANGWWYYCAAAILIVLFTCYLLMRARRRTRQ